MTRHTHLVLVLLVATAVAVGGVVASVGFGGVAAQQSAASVTIEDQASDGQTVIVDSVTLPDGGFVVIHDETLADGDAVGSVIGVSTYLEPGTHEDVPVTLSQELDSIEAEVTAMAHMDTNGNEVSDFVTADGAVDGPYTTGGAEETPTETEAPETTEEGTQTGTPTETETGTPMETETETEAGNQAGGPVVDTALIDAVGDGVPATNLEFEDQTSDGTTLTVQRVTLYRGGYVVIHDSTLQEDGDALGSVVGHSEYLPPGTYEDVEVTLARPLDVENETSVEVTAMPHFETNENLVFDFVVSTGTEDDPYLDENESAVVATASVTGEAAEETPTETEAPTETTEAPETTEGEETTMAPTETEGAETTTEPMETETATEGGETPTEEMETETEGEATTTETTGTETAEGEAPTIEAEG